VEGEGGSEELVYDLELALVVDLLDVAANQAFVLCRHSGLLLLERTLTGAISSTDQHDAIDSRPVATVRSASLAGVSVNSGRAQKMKYLQCPSQVPGGLEDGQK
jgi:hypothetical protein